MERVRRRKAISRKWSLLNKERANHRDRVKRDKASPAKAKVNVVHLPMAKTHRQMVSRHPTANRAKAARKVKGLADKAIHPATPPNNRAKRD